MASGILQPLLSLGLTILSVPELSLKRKIGFFSSLIRIKYTPCHLLLGRRLRRQLDLTQLGATVDLKGNCVGDSPNLEQVLALPPAPPLSLLPGPSLDPCEKSPALGPVCSSVQAHTVHDLSSGSLLTMPLPAVRRVQVCVHFFSSRLSPGC